MQSLIVMDIVSPVFLFLFLRLTGGRDAYKLN